MSSSDLVNDISAQIESKYNRKGWGKAWQSERETILELAEEIFVKPKERLFDYEEALGVGATGVVLGVMDNVMRAKRAMKLPRPRGDLGPEIREGFEGEIQRLLSLSHQNIVRIYHQNNARVRRIQYPYFVMEFIEGGKDLVEAVSEGVADTPEKLLHCVRQAAVGLEFLHSRGIVHFDLKPGNVLVAPNGQAMITDLGFSKNLANVDPGTKLLVRFTKNYAHPD